MGEKVRSEKCTIWVTDNILCIITKKTYAYNIMGVWKQFDPGLENPDCVIVDNLS